MKGFFKVLCSGIVAVALLTGCAVNSNVEGGIDISAPIENDGGDVKTNTEDNSKENTNGTDTTGSVEATNGNTDTTISDGDTQTAGGNTSGTDNTKPDGASLGTEAEINAQYFVKIGDRTYFRGYGENSFENPCLWGEYLNNCNGGSSFIYYYDGTTGEAVKAFEDFGYGKIVFMDGVFFMNGLNVVSYTPYVYAVDAEGKEVALPRQYNGEIKGYSAECGMMFVQDNRNIPATITGVDKKGNEAFTIESENPIELMGYYQDQLVYAESVYSENLINIYSYNIGGSGKATKIAAVTKAMGEKICDYTEYFDIEWVEFGMEGECYIGAAFRSGTGGFLDGGAIIKAYPWEANSGNIVEQFSGTYELMPYICTDEGGNYHLCENEPFTYTTVQNTNGNYDLFYQGFMGERSFVTGDFLGPWSYTDEHTALILAENVMVGGNEIFAMRASQIYDADGSIGWRDGYRAIKIEYVRIDTKTGKAEVILTQDHIKNFRG